MWGVWRERTCSRAWGPMTVMMTIITEVVKDVEAKDADVIDVVDLGIFPRPFAYLFAKETYLVTKRDLSTDQKIPSHIRDIRDPPRLSRL